MDEPPSRRAQGAAASPLVAPVSWWVLVGIVLVGLAAVLLVIEAASLQLQLQQAPDGYAAIQPAWPMLGTLVLGALGLGSVHLGRSRRREARLHAARVARVHGARTGPVGVSPGVAGTGARSSGP